MPPAARAPFPPPPPDSPVQEGARWRWHRPDSEAVAAWFATQPLDDEMEHRDFVGGVVLIPQSEKVKYTRPDGQGTTERYEQVFTPYVQIGTRVGYFRRLAEHRGLIPVIEPEEVPRAQNPQSLYFNGNMPPGLWWHVVQGDSKPMRYLCATYRVSMYTEQSYAARLRGHAPLPMVSGTGTKQVGGGVDPNGIMKAQTGAIGRALGVAGILVIGTGIATAEDMQEFSGLAAVGVSPDQAQLPDALPSGPAVEGDESPEALRTRAVSLQAQMQELPGGECWREFATWWKERADSEGWTGLNDVPADSLKGIVARMERDLAASRAAAATARQEGGEESPDGTNVATEVQP